MTTWSHSRLDTFETCPRKYFYNYVQKPDPAQLLPDGVEAMVGTVVHEVAERAYHHVRTKGLQPRVEQGLAYGRRRFAERYAAERPHIARKGMTGTDYAELVERCVRNLWAIVGRFDPLPVIGLERRVTGTLGGQNFQGYIDRMELSAADNVLTILDYKTGQRAKTPAQIREDQQLSRYALLARRELGHTGPIRRVWVFLAPGVVREGESGTVRPRDVEARVAATVGEIMARPLTADAFEPRPSPLCRWCRFSPVCPSARV